MPNQHDFKVGDVVTFKPEHRDYEFTHFASNGALFEISYLPTRGQPLAIFTDTITGAYLHRLQPNVFLTAARAVVRSTQESTTKER